MNKNGNKRKFKAALLAFAMIAVMMVGSISAYFTDGDTATNTFTVGKISLDLQEPNWDEDKAKELAGKIIIGEFVKRHDRTEYTKQYDEIIARANGGA